MERKDIKSTGKSAFLNMKKYDFLREEPKLKGKIELLVMSGSRAYGTDLSTSDYDVRGMCLESPTDIIGFSAFEQYDEKETDTTIYGFNKFIKLLSGTNPNIVEFLGVREEDIFHVGAIGRQILENKEIFLSKRASSSFGGYAMQQLNRMENGLKAGGKVVEKQRNSLEAMIYTFNNRYSNIPMDSVIARVDDEDELVLDMDLKGYPLKDMRGMMSEMSEVLKHQGVGNRNKKASVEKLDKHAMHLIRLYYMALDILERGEIITYREKEHKLLMDIRLGKYRVGDTLENVTYRQEFWDMLQELREKFEYARRNTNLPDEPNRERIEEFVMDVNKKIVTGKI